MWDLFHLFYYQFPVLAICVHFVWIAKGFGHMGVRALGLWYGYQPDLKICVLACNQLSYLLYT
jgi:hypothetical protein